MGSKSKAPKAPNYAALAKQQAALDKAAAAEQTLANRADQYNPYGSLVWDKNPDGSWTQKETWDPAIKAGMDAALANQNNWLTKASEQGDFVAPDAVNWDPSGSKAYSDAMYTNYASRALKEQGDAQTKMQTQLRQQGLQPGTEAYDRAYKNLLTSQGDANAKASLDAEIAGYDQYRQSYLAQLQGQNQAYGQAKDKYLMPWDQAAASQGLVAGAYKPTFQTYAGGTGYNAANIAGAGQAGYNAKMADYNAGQQKKQNTVSTAGKVGTSAISAFSDSTMKMDIEQITGVDALRAILEMGGYAFRWKENGEPDMGVMAQEVQAVLPELVDSINGKLMVHYTKIVALLVEAVKYLAEKHHV